MTITTEVVRLTSAVAELLIHADFETDPGDVTLTGSLMGPRCPGAETIEIAYALKPLPRAAAHRRSARVVIPEPNLWEADSPFTYWGTVETRQGDQSIETRSLEIGVRK